MGVVVWPMVELEADDALASAATSRAERRSGWRRSASGRRTKISRSASSAIASCRWIAAAARSAMPRACARSSASRRRHSGLPRAGRGRRRRLSGDSRLRRQDGARIIERYGALEEFPAEVLDDTLELALLFKRLATLRSDAALFPDVEALRWAGVTPGFATVAERIADERLTARLLELEKR